MQNAKFKMQTLHAGENGVNAAAHFTQPLRNITVCILNFAF